MTGRWVAETQGRQTIFNFQSEGDALTGYLSSPQGDDPIAEGKITLSVNNPDSGSASEEIEADYDSAPIDIGFNARYLLDIVGQLSSDTASIRLADPGSPTLIQDREGAPALFVLMPLRV